MGDRCHMNLSFGGHIEDHEALKKVIGALAVCGARPAKYFAPTVDGKSQPALLGPTNFVLWCFVAAELPEYEFEEVNYAQLPCASALHLMGLDVLTNNSAGGEYPAGSVFYDGATKTTFEWSEHEEDRIGWNEIEFILALDLSAEERLHAIRGAIEERRRLQSRLPRDLTFGPELEARAIATITALRMKGLAA